MTTYQEIKDPFTENVVIKKTDIEGNVWFIPIDPANSDYQEYLKHEATAE